MKIKAYAKINLGLDVLSKREDGYHELLMVMLPIELYDLIDIEPSTHAFFRCIPPYRILPEKNTLLKAVEVCREARPFSEQFRIHLHKTIPSQAGLGGGSSDAAAVINYLNDYFKWNLSIQEKIELGLKVGADVPFCLFNKPAIVSGIGEKLSFFTVKNPMSLILVQPHKGVSTKLAFKDLQLDKCDHPDILKIARALETGNELQLYEHMGNALEKRAVEMVPEIDMIKKELLDYGCDHSMMTGSGSVVMGFSQDEAILQRIAKDLKGHYRFVKITKVLD
ncbi:MAG: 4-diphosphocytidyl-2C-methyl-D-erythritol kinase [Erysipelotrichaceae bacterium]|nr:MAG: 4-diphosphocytidyl-2C-methyl-D-erythritol [Erysipelotrichaceae bacterium]TXT19613.1 MAG: 4-diphosphocytidyl-2C-methyl-D-erythritol kinase [Erysipelotrichaceae bacterium]